MTATLPGALPFPGAPAVGGASRLPGITARGAGWAVLVLAVTLLPQQGSASLLRDATLGASYAVVGLSLNILVGYAGQLSLGHQGFYCLGALAAANVVDSGLNAGTPLQLFLGAVAAIGVCTVFALALGAIALRITGLYLSLVTLVFGVAVTASLGSLDGLTNGGSGVHANRPDSLTAGRYYVLCVAIVVAVFLLDRRVTATKAGRAMLALKENERAAQAFGVDVTRFKLLAFAMSGALAGLGGVLFVYSTQLYSSNDFSQINLALLFPVIVVVGGLGNRVGVAVAGFFFAMVTDLLGLLFDNVMTLKDVPLLKAYYDPQTHLALGNLIGAVLLLQTLIFNPGGLGASLRPAARWLSGGAFRGGHDDDGGIAAVEGSDVRA